MTPSDELKAETILLLQQHPLFPLFVLYGLQCFSQRIDMLSDLHIYTLFGGRYDPDSVKSDLETITRRLSGIMNGHKDDLRS